MLANSNFPIFLRQEKRWYTTPVSKLQKRKSYLQPLVNAFGVKLVSAWQHADKLMCIEVVHAHDAQRLCITLWLMTEAVWQQLVNVTLCQTTRSVSKTLGKIQQCLSPCINTELSRLIKPRTKHYRLFKQIIPIITFTCSFSACSFSDLTRLGVKKSIWPAKIHWLMRCWCGYVWSKVQLMATATTKPQHLLLHLNPDCFNFSGTGILRLSWKRGH